MPRSCARSCAGSGPAPRSGGPRAAARGDSATRRARVPRTRAQASGRAAVRAVGLTAASPENAATDSTGATHIARKLAPRLPDADDCSSYGLHSSSPRRAMSMRQTVRSTAPRLTTASCGRQAILIADCVRPPPVARTTADACRPRASSRGLRNNATRPFRSVGMATRPTRARVQPQARGATCQPTSGSTTSAVGTRLRRRLSKIFQSDKPGERVRFAAASGRRNARQQPADDLPVAADPALMPAHVARVTCGVVLVQQHVAQQARARITTLEQVVAEDPVVGKALLAGALERIDVVDALADERAFPEQVLVDV